MPSTIPVRNPTGGATRVASTVTSGGPTTNTGNPERSPCPATRISGVSSLVSARRSILPTLPEPSWVNDTWPWYATIAPFTDSTSGPSVVRTILLFCFTHRSPAATSALTVSNRWLRTVTPLGGRTPPWRPP